MTSSRRAIFEVMRRNLPGAGERAFRGGQVGNGFEAVATAGGRSVDEADSFVRPSNRRRQRPAGTESYTSYSAGPIVNWELHPGRRQKKAAGGLAKGRQRL